MPVSGFPSARAARTRSMPRWRRPWLCTSSQIGSASPVADTTARIETLRAEAEAAISAAADAAALEELRVRYLGRKAELTSILRGISELDPAERGPVGKAGNEAR